MNDNMLNSLLIEAGIPPIQAQTEHVAGWGEERSFMAVCFEPSF